MTDRQPPTADDLARTRTDLAVTRTAMAADRTLMAWIRTALSMISFGFAIHKFLSSILESSRIATRDPEGPRNLGLFLTSLGTAALVAGIVGYLQTMRGMGVKSPSRRVTFYTACAVVVLGLMVLVRILARVGPF